MKNFLNTQTVIGSLVIAIIGSALWETIFKNVLGSASKILLTISTLGIEQYKDDIYINIARGFYEQVSLQILNLIFGLFFGVIAVALTVKNKNTEEQPRVSKFKEFLKNHRRFAKIFFLTYIFFVAGVTILSLAKITYINKSISYYKQLETISAPYLTDEQEKIFNSKFAQIKNREDYLKIINDLKLIINDKIQNLPDSPSFIF